MFKKILRLLLTAIGVTVGFFSGVALTKTKFIQELGYFETTLNQVLLLIFSTLLVGLIFYLISPWINKFISRLMEQIEKHFQRLTASEIIFGALGAIIALIISFFVASPLNKIPVVGVYLFVLVNITAAFIGANIAGKKRDDVMSLFGSIKKSSTSSEKKSKTGNKPSAKVLDTSVIIDGRIFDICQTGFVEGSLVIPGFVLDELRHISDSSDALKRNRGRRGLDILNKIQKELNIEVQIWEGDFPEIAEVDSKLLKLAQTIGGKVVTNDYNLNKVAEFQGVPVLNINELANAIKPVVLPGEEMTILIIKDGKESNQGIGYLDDGTMIVVEGGKKFIGEVIDVIVTSVLQTAAGRMIFAKQKDVAQRA
ncbi:PIN/TRAM domain-containing protein [Clostridium polynesiense]|uniref:PIN/TRAM domain-containing protein n=1 Tax=Clostridium polynesiense TaxID=1325933 RepID=UPI00058DB046|nr:PIN/TRAM domain-containing protein [Clostridium polynesiense]